MKTFLTVVFLGVAAVGASVTSAEACSRSVSQKAARTMVPTQGIDHALLNAAIRAEVNFHRCRAGLPALADAGGGMTAQAKKHSQWMARTQQLTHRSTVPGAASLQQRVKRAGLKVRTGSENIGMVHRYQIDNRRFRIVNSGACQFTTYEGQALPAHSYASLARHAVTLWMNSPGHRRNILDRRVSRTTTAIAFDPRSQHCGRFWLTQNFVG